MLIEIRKKIREKGRALRPSKRLLFSWLLLGTSLFLMGAGGTTQPQKWDRTIDTGKIFILTVVGSINAGTADYIRNGIAYARNNGAALIIIRLDTPGGFLEATRDIVKAILNSTIPIAVFVTPSGARAGSAGVFITMAGHIAAMSPGTNIGAAHPVTGGGKDPEKSGGKHMAKKILNDTVAFVKAIAKKRHRNVEWAKKAVVESDSITADEALKLKVIDLIAYDTAELIRKLDGWIIDMDRQKVKLVTKNLQIKDLPMSFKQKVVNFFSDPRIAYYLMMFGLLGIVMEIYHPGAVFPGVLGAICLFLAFVAMQVLPINYGGLALILLGIVLLVAELFTPTFGVLFIGGTISLTIGSIFLIDSPDPNLRLSLGTVLPMVSVLAILLGLALYGVTRAYQNPIISGKEGMIGEVGVVKKPLAPKGVIKIRGELWNAVSIDGKKIEPEREVEVVEIDGLTLKVKLKDGGAPEGGEPTSQA